MDICQKGRVGYSSWSRNFKGLFWTYCLLMRNPYTVEEKKRKAFRLQFSHEREKERSKHILSFINYLTPMLISILVANPHCIKDRACAMCLKCVSLSAVSSRQEWASRMDHYARPSRSKYGNYWSPLSPLLIKDGLLFVKSQPNYQMSTWGWSLCHWHEGCLSVEACLPTAQHAHH